MRVPAFPNAVRTPAPTFSTLHRSALFLIVWDAHLCTTCCFFLPFSFVHIAVTPLPEFQPQPILCPRVSSYSHLPFATARAATHSHMSHEDIIPHTVRSLTPLSISGMLHLSPLGNVPTLPPIIRGPTAGPGSGETSATPGWELLAFKEVCSALDLKPRWSLLPLSFPVSVTSHSHSFPS